MQDTLADLLNRAHDCDVALQALAPHAAPHPRHHKQSLLRDVKTHGAHIVQETALDVALSAGKNGAVLLLSVFIRVESLQNGLALAGLFVVFLGVSHGVKQFVRDEE